ncbi:helix-turn-helix transcriptional regulator [Devosia faecipullorum]|uniref:helix-turn-helix transcriptional regulator n=1 Tax=Devosia faecipullorum TaxID=2755039 RepID=UPI00187B6705|nr:helix-turn-helix domain-containing protein [Devosia faecipullorum]MBE7734509.1 helix-turn-helix domain-containing protein [Devosia faecipullorum]
MSSRRASSPGHQGIDVPHNFTRDQARPACQESGDSVSATPRVYLTRSDVAERYPISTHTLAKLASQGKGPRYFKPTDKCLYRPEDIEAWIEATAILPSAVATMETGKARSQSPTTAQNGRGKAKPTPIPSTRSKNGRKSLLPSANSWLRRTD